MVGASGCQLPLTPLPDITLDPGDALSNSVVPLVEIDRDDVSVKPEPQPNAPCVKSHIHDNISCVQSQEHDSPSRKSPPPSMTINMSGEQQPAFL